MVISNYLFIYIKLHQLMKRFNDTEREPWKRSGDEVLSLFHWIKLAYLWDEE
jgi:hypothetical protein